MTPSRFQAEWIPWAALGAFAVCWAARWPLFPLSLDPWYHLFIGRQIADAGGLIGYEWWEDAPGGRPHLYPPVLHLLLALLLKAGCSPVTALRLLSVLVVPALLVTLFVVLRRLAGFPLACAALWSALTPFSFHLRSAVTMAATLGMIELLWLMDAIAHGRRVAAGVLLGLLWYTHLGMPWIALAVLACQAALAPSSWRVLLNALWGLLFAVPWWMHLLRYRAALHVTPRYENATVELVPVLCGFALLGVWQAWRMRGNLRWFLACLGGFGLLAVSHRYRWLSGEGMLPVILLSGVGVAWLLQRARSRRLAGVIIGALLLAGPTLVHTPAGWSTVWRDSAPWHLLGWKGTTRKEIDETLYSRQLRHLVRLVETVSRPGDILWSNAPYALGAVAGLAHRATASAMLAEVQPQRPIDPIGAARFIVWFKIDPLPETIRLDELKGRYPVTPVAEDDLALIFARPADAAGPLERPRAALPLGAAAALLVAALGAVLWDYKAFVYNRISLNT